MSSELLALLAAVVGAGGAILAQTISSVFTARREARRLAWEKTTAKEERTQQQAERFVDLKRSLYSQYLRLTYTYISDVNMKLDEEERTSQLQVLERKLADHLDELDALRWEIQLIAPHQVGASVELTYVHLVSGNLVYYRPDEFTIKHRKRSTRQGLDSWQDMRHLMRADLDADPAALERVARAVRDRPKRAQDKPESEESAWIRARLRELQDSDPFASSHPAEGSASDSPHGIDHDSP